MMVRDVLYFHTTHSFVNVYAALRPDGKESMAIVQQTAREATAIKRTTQSK
jgi:hypothetical protein